MTPHVSQPHLRAWSLLLATQTALVAAVEDALAQADLPPLAWYDVLWPLHEADRPLRMGELSAGVVTIGRTGLTRLVDRLAAAGMLKRTPSKTDRRGVEVAITAEGKRLLKRMWPVYATVVNSRFATVLDEGDAAQLTDLLERIAVRSPSAATA